MVRAIVHVAIVALSLSLTSAMVLAQGSPLGGPSDPLTRVQQNFALINRTGHQINELYVSPPASASWGRDILGEDVIPTGTRRNITLPQGIRLCIFDVRVVYADGTSGEVRGVNLCEVSNVTLTWNGGTRYRVD
jgi:hypothetical protein